MQSDSLDYTWAAAEIAYDTDLLEFAGHADLKGWAASVAKSATNKVALRSIPTMNMSIGQSCSSDINIVTLKFTVKGGFTGDSIDTDLDFASVFVAPPGGVSGTTIAPGKSMSFTLQK